MKKLHGKIDWIIAEDDKAWQASQSAAQPARAPGAQRRQKLAFATLTAALLLLLIGGWIWPGSTPDKGTIHKLAQAAAPLSAQEEQPLTQTFESHGDLMYVDTIQRSGDHIISQVIVNYHEEDSVRAYRETRFYAKKEDGWQRIAPDPALLGPQKTLQTANFTILYRTMDTAAVYEAAPKLEQLYATMRHDFGLPVLVPAVAYTIAYTIEIAGGGQDANFYNYGQNKLTIPSPFLLSAPVEITAATLIEQATIYPLAHLLVHEAIKQHDTRWQSNYFKSWYPMENALALWELWQTDGALASTRAALVHWLYKNSNRRPLPDAYAQLCRTYRIWQLIPSDHAIPLVCSQEDAKIDLAAGYPPLVASWPQATGYSGPTGPTLQIANITPITLETLIEYIVATYGRDKLPQFFDALGQETSPTVLIPTLFGSSRADFEAAWQAYLAQHD